MSHRYPIGKFRGKKLLIVLLALGLIAILLPRRWTQGLVSVVQVIVPMQDLVSQGTDAVSTLAPGDADGIDPQQHAETLREKTALENQVVSLAARVRELETDVELLEGTRAFSVEGQRLGGRGRLIPARVISPDMVPWRASRLVNAGTLQGVRLGAPVLSDYFTISAGEQDGLHEGLAILLRETIVGFVEQTGTHTARIKLLSDPKSEMKVRIGRRQDARVQLREELYWLTGKGEGRMEIRDVQRRDVEAGLVQKGDIVVSTPFGAGQSELPSSMRIGTIISLAVDHDNPLLCIATVRNEIREDDLRRVYVYDPATRD